MNTRTRRIAINTMSKLYHRRPAVLGALAALGILLAAVPIAAADETGNPAARAAGSELPEKKRTTLGLYVTAAEAYEMWRSAPDKVKVIDVRSPEEYAFVGHPEMSWNIPFAFVTYQRKDGRFEYGSRMNPDFVAHVSEVAAPTDVLLVTCRSGGRSARAVNALAAAGFKNAYTIVDGVEGDKVHDPDSVFHGKRMKNGWKNSAPWVYSIDPEKVILEEGTSKQTE
jgi:rhodanese-related sulfurtransferase